MADFKEITTMKYWCQKVLPLVYDDSLSYYELLNKVVLKLNDLIENNKQLPDYISKLIQEYISTGAIGEVVRNILTDFMLNVKNPPNNLKPAVGDGTADDTEAIQGCIDYANSIGGGCVYVPNGVYLTQSLTLYDNVSFFGFDRYSSRLVLKGGATKPMFTGNVTNTSLTGLTIDGNMDIQVNSINLIDINADELILQNLVLTDGYVLVNTTVNKSTQISDVICDYSVVQHMNLSGSGLVLGSNIYLHDISKLKGTNLITLNNNNSVLSNIVSNVEAPVGFIINGNNNSISGTFDNAVIPFEDNGVNNTIINNGKTEQLKITGNRSNSVGGNETNNIVGKYEINSENIKLNPTQPLEYKEPVELDEYFKTIPFKNGNNNYEVLVKGEKSVNVEIGNIKTDLANEIETRINDDISINNNIEQLDEKLLTEIEERIEGEIGLQEQITGVTSKVNKLKIYNVLDYGAKGDGIQEDGTFINQAITTCYNNGGGIVYIPSGVFLSKHTIDIKRNVTLIMTKGTTLITDVNINLIQIKPSAYFNGGGGLITVAENVNYTSSFIYLDGVNQYGLIEDAIHTGAENFTIKGRYTGTGIKLYSGVPTDDKTFIQFTRFKDIEIFMCEIGIHLHCPPHSNPIGSWVNANEFDAFSIQGCVKGIVVNGLVSPYECSGNYFTNFQIQPYYFYSTRALVVEGVMNNFDGFIWDWVTDRQKIAIEVTGNTNYINTNIPRFNDNRVIDKGYRSIITSPIDKGYKFNAPEHVNSLSMMGNQDDNLTNATKKYSVTTNHQPTGGVIDSMFNANSGLVCEWNNTITLPVIIEIDLTNKPITTLQNIGVSFASTLYTPKGVKIEGYTNAWYVIGETTDNTSLNYSCFRDGIGGVSKIRITLFNTDNIIVVSRIYAQDSASVGDTFVSTSGSNVYGNLEFKSEYDGVILKDGGNGKRYKIAVYNGVISPIEL